MRETENVLYVSKRGRLAAAVLDADHYAELVDRLEHLEDSLAVMLTREERDRSTPWPDVRNS